MSTTTTAAHDTPPPTPDLPADERCANPVGCEERGTEDMGNGTKFCTGCCSSAQGSGHDDRQDWS